MLRIQLYSLAIAAFLLTASLSSYSQTIQTSFEVEGGVNSPVTIPADVIAVLKSDRTVDTCFRTEGAGTREEAWFEASEFDLNGDGRLDLIIKPKHSCLLGANQGPFWIFQNVHDGHQKILTASGLKLTIMPRRVNSFNVVAVSKAVRMKGHDTQFRFSQGKYRPAN